MSMGRRTVFNWLAFRRQFAGKRMRQFGRRPPDAIAMRVGTRNARETGKETFLNCD